MCIPLLLLLLAAGPAWSQTPGLCSAIPDRAARPERLNRPPERAPAPQPPAAAVPGCTQAAPCTDLRGA
jgi:hypothetical protein